MGATKSIPVIGEAVTAVDATVKLGIAGVAAIAGDDDTADKFVDAARDSLLDYSLRSPVVAAVLTPVYAITNEEEALKDHWKKVGSSCGELVDGLPVAGHVKGAIHLANGDIEQGLHCLKAATRSTVVIGVTVLTAGAGAPLVAASAVTSGLAVDGYYTGVQSLASGEFSPSGHVESFTHAIKTEDPVAFADAALGFGFECTAAYAAASYADELVQKQNVQRLYRVVDESMAKEAVTNQQLPKAVSAGLRPAGETWITESVEHSKQYIARGNQPANVNFETLQMNVDKSWYQNMRDDSVPQKGSRAPNSGPSPRNVFNQERLENRGKANIGIKNTNLPEFNKNVKVVKKIDPNSWRYRNGVTKAVSRYGADATGYMVSNVAGESIFGKDDDDDCYY